MTTEQIYKLFLTCTKVETDSRKITEGCLFIALKGEKFNGNKFADEALKKGAALAIIDEPEFSLPSKTILVENALATLQKLAYIHRKELGIPILAITGTNGKTTTKELVATVLSSSFQIVFTPGNLNNHIGVPLTLLQMNRNTQIGVVEMGANHPGEIQELCSIADPDLGIITNIGRAHLQGFGSFENIVKTKSALYDHLKRKNGTIFYHHENAMLAQLVDGFQKVVNYGENDANLTGTLITSSPYIEAEIQFPGEKLAIHTRLTGSYNFENILAAACVGNYFGVEPGKIQQALSNYQPQNNRSQLIEKGELKIILDAYNANPTSMQASIESFVTGFFAPRYLILGDMLELGTQAITEHQTILEQIKKHPVEKVFLVGPLFHEVARNYPFSSFTETGELIRYLTQNSLRIGTVLIKGSRGMQLENVLECL